MVMMIRRPPLLAIIALTVLSLLPGAHALPSTSSSTHNNSSSSSNNNMEQSPLSASSSNVNVSGGTILVIGASGSTGLRVLAGFLDMGYVPSQLRLLTRNINKPTSLALRQFGFQVVQGDLDEPSSLSNNIFSSSSSDENGNDIVGIYIHSTTGDTQILDTGEVDRAKNLAAAIQTFLSSTSSSTSTTSASTSLPSSSSLRRIVYNSSAAEKNHGIHRIQQKHDVETVFRDMIHAIGKNGNHECVFASLRANLFMEDFWKKYTRPSILDGKFPFSIPSDRKVYLTSVRDMGRLAAMILLRGSGGNGGEDEDGIMIINVASDILTPHEMAQTYAKVQGSKCIHTRNHFFALLARLFFKDLHELMRFYSTSTEETDVEALKHRFPEVRLTSFEDFLVETNWKNRELTYEDYWLMDMLLPRSTDPPSARDELYMNIVAL